MMDNQSFSFAQQLDPLRWQTLSPRRLEHKVYIPTAITLHRLAPRTPRTSKSHRRVVPNPYKHLDPEEIERAQARARHILLEERLSKEGANNNPPHSPASQDNKDVRQDHHRNVKNTKIAKDQKQPEESVMGQNKDKQTKGIKDGQRSGQPFTRPKFPVYRGIGEANLRIRQITKFTKMINDCLHDLETMPMKTGTKDFITPHEIEVKRKRWNEFLHSAGRMLFTLKREITLMERTTKLEEKGDKFLRMLASSTRTLHKLLLAVKTYSETAFQSPLGKKLYCDLIVVCRRLFAITSALGISSPKWKLKVPVEGIDDEVEESSVDSSELATSEVNSSDLNVLQPDYIRQRLSEIAHEKLHQKRKKKNEEVNNGKSYSPQQKNSHKVTGGTKGREKTKTETVSPLKYFYKSQPSSPSQGYRQSQQSLPRKTCSHMHKVVFADNPMENQSAFPDKEGPHSSVQPVRETYNAGQVREESPASIESHMHSEGTTLPRKELSSGSKTPPQQFVNVCKMPDHNQLAEETANAVISRLIPLISHDAKRAKDEEASKCDVKSGEDMDKKGLPVEDFSHQIQFMLERVCRIEEEQKKSLDIVMEVSRRTEKRVTYPENTLQTAIKQAENVMHNLASREKQVTSFDTHIKTPATLIRINNFQEELIKNTYDSRQRTFHKNRSIDSDENFEFKESNSLVENEDVVDDSEHIADQIKYQKEEFWASLVKRGFVKPHEVTSDGTTAANEAIELMLKQSDEKYLGILKETKSSKEDKVLYANKKKPQLKGTIPSTNVKRDVALTKTKQVDKATLTSLLSYSNSSQTESINNSYSSVKTPDETESCEKTSDEARSNFGVTNSDDVHSSHTGRDYTENFESSESASFPSYDGVSNSNQEKDCAD